MSLRTIAVGALGLTVLAGCTTTDPYTGAQTPNRAATGAIIGAIGGAAVGAATNTSDGSQTTKNAAIGAAVGAVAGGAAGAYMDRQQKALEERLAQSQVEVRRTAENEILLNMPSDITFAVNSATIQPQFASTLNTISQTLAEYSDTLIDVTGHADSTGSDDYNMALSERRAQSVQNALQDRGIQPARIVAAGRGETQPIADNGTAAGRQQNRRVEIRLRPLA
jgi:outer membrane protein OmpA-like peptidoglycan-associated protein